MVKPNPLRIVPCWYCNEPVETHKRDDYVVCKPCGRTHKNETKRERYASQEKLPRKPRAVKKSHYDFAGIYHHVVEEPGISVAELAAWVGVHQMGLDAVMVGMDLRGYLLYQEYDPDCNVDRLYPYEDRSGNAVT